MTVGGRYVSSQTPLRTQYRQEKQPRIKPIKCAQPIHCTALRCQAGRWHGSHPCQLSPEIKYNQKKPTWVTEEPLRAIKLHKQSRDCSLCSYTRVEGNPRFGKQRRPTSYLQPSPACTRCPAAGVSERKSNRKRAGECNMLAMPNRRVLCQGQLGTATGKPKIRYIPKLSRTETPDTYSE